MQARVQSVAPMVSLTSAPALATAEPNPAAFGATLCKDATKVYVIVVEISNFQTLLSF